MTSPRLDRRLGTGDAVFIGLGSMIGAGVFSAVGAAAEAAGGWLLLGLAAAGLVAYCNAVSSAQLAAEYPVSGGSYVYGRERLGAWWGFAAGWCFLVGKTASCAAMALTFGGYVAPDSDLVRRLTALGAVAVLTLVATRGVTRTALLTRVLVTVTLLVLAVTVGVLLVADPAPPTAPTAGPDVTPRAVLQSAGLLFFAFAGYARIATMGEEVRAPSRTIPRAIPVALGLTLVVYLAVAAAALHAVGAAVLAGEPAPLAAALGGVGASWARPLVAFGAAVASLGALLALLTGIGRTGLAMGRNRDLPGWLARVHPGHRVPQHAQVAVGLVVAVLVLVADLRQVIGFSSFGVLLYYAVANASAFTQDAAHRRWPRAVNLAGLAGCLVLAAALPLGSVLVGVGVVAAGLGGRQLARPGRRNGSP